MAVGPVWVMLVWVWVLLWSNFLCAGLGVGSHSRVHQSPPLSPTHPFPLPEMSHFGACQVPAKPNSRDLLFRCQGLSRSFNKFYFLSMRFRAEFGFGPVGAGLLCLACLVSGCRLLMLRFLFAPLASLAPHLGLCVSGCFNA